MGDYELDKNGTFDLRTKVCKLLSYVMTRCSSLDLVMATTYVFWGRQGYESKEQSFEVMG